MMDPDTIYEEETVELNTESDSKEQNTDSENEVGEVVHEEEVTEQHLDEVHIMDSAPVHMTRKTTAQQPQILLKKGNVYVSSPYAKQGGESRQVQRAVAAKPSPVRIIPSQKIINMPKGIKLTSVNSGQVVSPQSLPLKRRAEGSPMIVKLENVKRMRPVESSPLLRPGSTPQTKVRIVRHCHAQTEISGDIMDQYQVIMEEDQQKIVMLEEQIRKLKYTPEMFENDDKRTEYFTGLDTFVTMITLFNTCEADLPQSTTLTKFEIFMLTLLKLRLKLPLPFLGYMFGVSPKAATYFYNECLSVLHGSLREVFSESPEAIETK